MNSRTGVVVPGAAAAAAAADASPRRRKHREQSRECVKIDIKRSWLICNARKVVAHIV